MDVVSVQWPPSYTLKKTRRARHVKFKASLHKGLELIVPYRFKSSEIPSLLELNKEWIVKQLDKLRVETQAIAATPLPTEIQLFSETWKVNYIPTNSPKVSLAKRSQQHELVLLGNIQDKNECKRKLNLWVKQQAKIILSKRLQELSLQTGLVFSEISIRNQRSRWGSCSSNNKISLNYKLVFLPQHLCDHILIHELAHTVHMNHSENFWQLVASLDPNWETHNKATRKSDALLPVWVRGF